MNPPGLPVACELFAQWQRARGGRAEPATRPFSRGWEALLDAAGLVSATDRNDAERDARALAGGGWVEIKTVRYKLHLIDSIAIPLLAEKRWCEIFGFVAPSAEEIHRIREFNWEPRLAFLREFPLSIPFTDLRRLNDFLKGNNGMRSLVPIKERSLQIFGNEKRLDLLLESALFRSERLDMGRDLHCETIGEPLPWKRGPEEAVMQPLIVIENAATWHTYCRWNRGRKLFCAVIYGCGNRFLEGVRNLPDIFAELGGPRRIFYFGDLDPHGLRIPQIASARSQGSGLPVVEPHLWSYRQLLTLGDGHGQPGEDDPEANILCGWLGEEANPVRRLFAARQRLAQEHVGWEFLQNCAGPDSTGF
jgi:hypothetical protein